MACDCRLRLNRIQYANQNETFLSIDEPTAISSTHSFAHWLAGWLADCMARSIHTASETCKHIHIHSTHTKRTHFEIKSSLAKCAERKKSIYWQPEQHPREYICTQQFITSDGWRSLSYNMTVPLNMSSNMDERHFA